MSETILAIEHFRAHDEDRWMTEAGYKIRTSEQEILLAIDDEASCCESWGYFLTEDDLDKFIGEVLLGITITDINRSSHKFEYGYDDPDATSLDAGDTLFVDIETSRGVLQFVAYNAHNGYYGHAARVSSKQLVHEKGL